MSVKEDVVAVALIVFVCDCVLWYGFSKYWRREMELLFATECLGDY